MLSFAAKYKLLHEDDLDKLAKDVDASMSDDNSNTSTDEIMGNEEDTDTNDAANNDTTEDTSTDQEEDDLDKLNQDVDASMSDDGSTDDPLGSDDGGDAEPTDDTTKESFIRLKLLRAFNDLLSLSKQFDGKIETLHNIIQGSIDDNDDAKEYTNITRLQVQNNKIQEQCLFILENFIENMNVDSLRKILKALCIKFETILEIFNKLENSDNH